MRANALPACLLLAACAAPPQKSGEKVFGAEVTSLSPARSGSSQPRPTPAVEAPEAAALRAAAEPSPDQPSGEPPGPSGAEAGPAGPGEGSAGPETAAVPGAAEASGPGAEGHSAGPSPRATERDLRERLAEGEDPTGAAAELVALLTGQERFQEALAVVDRALERAPDDTSARLLHVALLRDLARRAQAVEELRALLAGPAAHPSMLFELAELEWLRGRRTDAAAALGELGRVHAEHPWSVANRKSTQALARELAEEESPRSVSVRDLLAELRGGELPSHRLSALMALQQASEPVRERAVVVALADPSGPVRAKALQLARFPAEQLAPLCRAGLKDADWQVRAEAASRTSALAPGTAIPMLLEAIAIEGESVPFQAQHEALQGATGVEMPLPVGGATRAEVRRQVVEAWRRACRG